MKLVLFTHYSLSKSASMPRFAWMIADGMRKREHVVEEWPCPVILGGKIRSPFIAKWLGYIDQFILFPRLVRKRLKSEPSDTCFVITDHALGPWVPLIADRPHVIHCHDFLAQRSALGEFPENPTGITGRLYQAYIRWGYRKGRSFLCVSKKTQEDLHRFLDEKPTISKVIYNGLNYPFCPIPKEESMSRLEPLPEFREMFAAQKSVHDDRQDACATNETLATYTSSQVSDFRFQISAPPRFILHVGGNQWYKNRDGVLLAYRAYCELTANPVPLVMIGKKPPGELLELANSIAPQGKVYFVTAASNEQVHAAYSLASVLFYPSLEEGFGWPIAEAMACGCLVITTNQTPMTEVGREAAYYIPRRNPCIKANDADTWSDTVAKMIQQVLDMSPDQRSEHITCGLKNTSRFGLIQTIEAYETIYKQVLLQETQIKPIR